MIDIDEFYEVLQEVCDELPDEFFVDLHSGVIISEEKKISPHARNNDLVIMGEYTSARYGNQITIYYGSFAQTCPYADREAVKNKLREVVRHEFRHHMENRSGMHGHDSLEYEDKVDLRRYINGES